MAVYGTVAAGIFGFLPVVNPVEKFDEPLTVDLEKDPRIFWIVLREFAVAAIGNVGYPDFAIDKFRG